MKRQDIVENMQTQQEDYDDLPQIIKDKLEWFQDQKIGVIFHWGLYSQAGIVESWQLSKEDQWARKKPWRSDLAILRRDYWQLNEVFNPQQFNANSWAQMCQQAGFKYMLFTTKHHDGFNMFDTMQSDYKITNGLFGVDVFKALSKSFHKVGLATGIYYSKPDWHSEYYWEKGANPKGRYASYDPYKKPEVWQKYNDFVKNQLVELTSYYGKQDILWLDGGWVNSQNNEYLDMNEIASLVRKEIPDLLIVDRTIGGIYENYVTPERKIPEIPPVKVWESNIPLAKNWGYVPNDSYKSFSDILEQMLQIVSLGGNVIFGVGPKPDGTLPKEAQEIMNKLGLWLNQYGEGIYGSRPAKEVHQAGWYFTQKEHIIYAFSFEQNNRINWSIFSKKPQKITNMNLKKQLSISDEFQKKSDDICTVIKIEF